MSKTIRNKFDEKLTYDNLMKAHLESRKNKSCKRDIILFNLKQENYIMYLYEQLKNLLDKLNVNYELVELSNCNENVGSSTYSDKENTKNIMKIIDYISKLDLDEISPKDAYNILEKLNTKCKSYFFD